MRKLLFRHCLLLTSLFCFSLRAASAQEKPGGLQVVSHVVRVNQEIREEEASYCLIIEDIEIENRDSVSYQDDLVFWVGEGEDLKAVVVRAGGNNVSLETKLEEGLVYVKLKEGVFIQPGERIRVGLDYKVFFADDQKGGVFDKKILYFHSQESLQFKVNSVENLGFFPQLEGLPFKRDEQESGWFISPMLSPQAGDVYRLRIIQEGVDGQEQGEVGKREMAGEEREPIVVAEQVSKLFGQRFRLFSNQVGKWTWKEMMTIFLLNDILVLGLIGWKCGWFKDSDFGRLFAIWQRLKKEKRKRGKQKKK